VKFKDFMMDKQKLVENFSVSSNLIKKIPLTEKQNTLIEAAGKQYEAVAAYTFPLSRPGKENLNGRVYTKKLWENVIKKKMGEGAFGLCDHPEDEGSVKDSYCVWHNIRFNEDKSLVVGDAYLFGPYGKQMHEAIQAGGKPGFSSVGLGEFKEDEKTIDETTYELQRPSDWVLNPSYEVFGDITMQIENIQEKKGLNESTLTYEQKLFLKQMKGFIEDINKLESEEEKLKECNELLSYFNEDDNPGSSEYAKEQKEAIESIKAELNEAKKKESDDEEKDSDKDDEEKSEPEEKEESKKKESDDEEEKDSEEKDDSDKEEKKEAKKKEADDEDYEEPKDDDEMEDGEEVEESKKETDDSDDDEEDKEPVEEKEAKAPADGSIQNPSKGFANKESDDEEDDEEEKKENANLKEKEELAFTIEVLKPFNHRGPSGNQTIKKGSYGVYYGDNYVLVKSIDPNDYTVIELSFLDANQIIDTWERKGNISSVEESFLKEMAKKKEADDEKDSDEKDSKDSDDDEEMEEAKKKESDDEDDDEEKDSDEDDEKEESLQKENEVLKSQLETSTKLLGSLKDYAEGFKKAKDELELEKNQMFTASEMKEVQIYIESLENQVENYKNEIEKLKESISLKESEKEEEVQSKIEEVKEKLNVTSGVSMKSTKNDFKLNIRNDEEVQRYYEDLEIANPRVERIKKYILDSKTLGEAQTTYLRLKELIYDDYYSESSINSLSEGELKSKYNF
jgi:hypothetical protein